MKTKFFFLSLLLSFFSLTLFAQEIAGNWKTIDDETGKEKSIIRIYKAKNGKYYGKVVKLLDTSKGENPLCTKCTDERKDKPIIDMVLIQDMELSDGMLKNGKILDPEKGKEYTCKIWIENGALKVRGYWGLFYRTQTWYKAG